MNPTSGPAALPNVRIVRHPLVATKLAALRDHTTSVPAFRRLVHELGALLAYEATAALPTRWIAVETPLETVGCEELSHWPTVVPILRAGLGLADGMLSVLTEARVGHLGLRRDERTLEPVSYYAKLPSGAPAGPVLVVDPMLATGGTAVRALDDLKARGCRDLRLVVLVATPQACARLLARHPDVPVLVAALDRELDPHGFIRPGLGDAGDRINGTLPPGADDGALR
jgi:uracil phosphoribosyltransferase